MHDYEKQRLEDENRKLKREIQQLKDAMDRARRELDSVGSSGDLGRAKRAIESAKSALRY
jgi:predicted RNase H-like nuclease (RuvC/YqgF family)